MIPVRVHSRRLAIAGWALALLLALAQQHAVLHWLTHAVAAASPHAKHANTNVACDECAGLAVFGSGAPAACVLLVLSCTRRPRVAVTGLSAPAQRPRIAYLSRAPPPSS